MPRKDQIPKGKKVLTVLISEDLYRKLMDYVSEVAKSEGRLRGLLSMVVEDALRLYLAPRTQHAQIHANPGYRVRKVYGQILEVLKQMLGALPADGIVHEKILEKAIEEVKGADPRTVSKWINVLLKHGLLKVVGGVPPNRVFELVYTPTD